MPQIKNKKTTNILSKIDITACIILENHQKWLKKGTKTTAELVKRIREEFGISKRTAERYIEEARKQIRTLLIKQRDKKLDKAILDREFVVNKGKLLLAQLENEENEENKNISFATKKKLLIDAVKVILDASKDRDKLNELYIERNENTNFDIDVTELTDHGLERIKRGDDPRQVILDPKSRKIKKDE